MLSVLYLTTSLLSTSLSVDYHWTTNRALMAERARHELDWSTICQHSPIVFTGNGDIPRQYSYTLSLANGPRVICQNEELEVYFAGVDQNIPPDAYSVLLSL